MAFTLKAARVNANLSRPKVVERLKAEYSIEITRNTLASYENKVTQPSVVIAKALASIYGMSIDDINFL
jgi:transcriptional regulator with XRE-family HTH domain